MGDRNPWLATDVLTDPRARARELREARARFFGAGAANGVRPLILASWRRSLAAGLRSGDARPAPAPDDDASARWDAHPLRAGLPFVRDALAAIAEEAQHLTAIADADGRLVWIDGPARLRQAAAELGFVVGAVWSERAAGTNGIGTALAVDHALQVFAGEHFRYAAQPWTAVAAPSPTCWSSAAP